jgi:hypothetical protein
MKRLTALFAAARFAGLMMLALLVMELESGQVSAAVPATFGLKTPVIAGDPASSAMTGLTQLQAENALSGASLAITYQEQLVKANQLLLTQPWSKVTVPLAKNKVVEPVATDMASSSVSNNSASNNDVNDADEPNDIFSADDVNDDNDDSDDVNDNDPNDDVNDADEPNDIFSADDVNDDDSDDDDDDANDDD